MKLLTLAVVFRSGGASEAERCRPGPCSAADCGCPDQAQGRTCRPGCAPTHQCRARSHPGTRPIGGIRGPTSCRLSHFKFVLVGYCSTAYCPSGLLRALIIFCTPLGRSLVSMPAVGPLGQDRQRAQGQRVRRRPAPHPARPGPQPAFPLFQQHCRQYCLCIICCTAAPRVFCKPRHRKKLLVLQNDA